MTDHTERKWGSRSRSSRLALRRKVYRSSIRKAKDIVRIKRMKTRLSAMVESFTTAKNEAAETVARLESVKMTRTELMDMLSHRIQYLERLRALESLMMVEIGLL